MRRTGRLVMGLLELVAVLLILAPQPASSSTGQSGNPFDPHYGDMIGLWANGGTVLLPSPRVAWPRAPSRS